MTSENDAPLFAEFWLNSELNPARASVMRERIAIDAAFPYQPPAPAYAAAPHALPAAASALSGILGARRSARAFSSAALTPETLAALFAPFARRPDGSFPLPSGGAKYPLWLYAGLLRVDGLPDLDGKICWYDPAANGLVPLAPCPAWPALQAVLGTDWASSPAAVFCVVARPEGMTAKYGERGGRFLLMEAGAYLAALSLAAAEGQLAGVALGSFRDRALLSLLGLDDGETLAMFAYAVGVAQPPGPGADLDQG